MSVLAVCICYVSEATVCAYVKHMLTIIRQFPQGKPVGRMESLFESTLYKSKISEYGIDSNFGNHSGKN